MTDGHPSSGTPASIVNSSGCISALRGLFSGRPGPGVADTSLTQATVGSTAIGDSILIGNAGRADVLSTFDTFPEEHRTAISDVFDMVQETCLQAKMSGEWTLQPDLLSFTGTQSNGEEEIQYKVTAPDDYDITEMAPAVRALCDALADEGLTRTLRTLPERIDDNSHVFRAISLTSLADEDRNDNSSLIYAERRGEFNDFFLGIQRVPSDKMVTAIVEGEETHPIVHIAMSASTGKQGVTQFLHDPQLSLAKNLALGPVSLPGRPNHSAVGLVFLPRDV